MPDSPKVPLGDRPGVSNWVERTGALKPHSTNWIYRVAEHLKGKGYSDGHAIAIAVNAAKYLCHSGDVKLPGHQNVNPGSRAEACAALAKWNSARARAKATNLTADYAIHKAIDMAAARWGRVIDLAAPSTAERERAEKQGNALPGGRFPIRNTDDLRKAIRAIGRAKPEDRERIKRFIKRRARELNATGLIPDSW